MKMEEIKNNSVWNDFVIQHCPRSGAFLQSWAWGEFQEAVGKTVFRFGWYDKKELCMIAQFFISKLPTGHTYLYCPRGPLIKNRLEPDQIAEAIEGIKKNFNAIFFRFDPPIESPAELAPIRMKKTIYVQPSNTLIIDLAKKPSELLESMHQKTRYNLHLAQKKDLRIEIRSKIELADVWHLFKNTSTRSAFRLHDRHYYKKLIESEIAFLSVAFFKERPIAANIMIDFAKTRTYLHGASDYESRSLMAPYLLHWRLINDAIENDFDYYDWWGVAPAGVDKHPLAGVTRFKKGFCGELVEYPGTFDIVFDPLWYAVYDFARKCVRAIR